MTIIEIIAKSIYLIDEYSIESSLKWNNMLIEMI